MNTQTPAIDPQLAISNAGGDPALAKDLYRMLQEELPGYLNTIPASYQQADYDKLYQHVHKLNGSATYCGVPALKQATQTFEQHIKQSREEIYAEDLAFLCEQIQRLMAIPELETN